MITQVKSANFYQKSIGFHQNKQPTNFYAPAGLTIQNEVASKQSANYIKMISSISFTGAQKTFNDFNNFKTQIKEQYPDLSINNVLERTISSPSNIIGKGKWAIVYEIPNIPDYLFRVENNKFQIDNMKDSIITPIPQDHLAPNLGQTIAESNNGFLVVKRVKGNNHSTPDWYPKYKAVSRQQPFEFTQEEAQELLSEFKKIAQFPQKSYDDLAKKVKYLNKETEDVVDFLNPNNILIDDENQEINIIDFHGPEQRFYDKITKPYSGVESMVYPLLDIFLHIKIYDALGNENSREELISASESIINKCKIAGEKVGLTSVEENISKTLKYTSLSGDITPYAQPCFDLYKDSLNFNNIN